MKIKIYSVAVKMIGIFCLLLTSQLSFAEVKVDPHNVQYFSGFVLEPGQNQVVLVACELLNYGGGFFSMLALQGGGNIEALVDMQQTHPPTHVWGSDICGAGKPNSLFLLATNTGNDLVYFGFGGYSYGGTFYISHE